MVCGAYWVFRFGNRKPIHSYTGEDWVGVTIGALIAGIVWPLAVAIGLVYLVTRLVAHVCVSKGWLEE